MASENSLEPMTERNKCCFLQDKMARVKFTTPETARIGVQAPASTSASSSSQGNEQRPAQRNQGRLEVMQPEVLHAAAEQPAMNRPTVPQPNTEQVNLPTQPQEPSAPQLSMDHQEMRGSQSALPMNNDDGRAFVLARMAQVLNETLNSAAQDQHADTELSSDSDDASSPALPQRRWTRANVHDFMQSSDFNAELRSRNIIESSPPMDGPSGTRPNKRARIASGNSSSSAGSGSDAQPDEFNLFQAIVGHPHLMLYVSKYLGVEELISVYAISRDFHDTIKAHSTTVIIYQAMRTAPTSAKIFPFRCYRRLCMADPRGELDEDGIGEVRLVPSFRWLRMICWREEIAHRIVTMMVSNGASLPKQCETVIKKIWFLMDIPDNQRRIGTIQNPELWGFSDLFFATLFVLKLELLCTNPLTAEGRNGMRRLLMAQPSLSLLYHMLNGTALKDKFEVIQAYIHWKGTLGPEDEGQFLFEIPVDEIGKLQYEGYGVGDRGVKLQRPDDLIQKECMRRGFDMRQNYFHIICWASGRPDTADHEDADSDL